MIRFYSVFLLLVLFHCEGVAGLSFASGEIKDKLSGCNNEYRFSFEFYNKSNVPVKIIDIVSSCDCVEIESNKKIYLPNEKGKINGVFNIADRVGEQKKEFIVITDESKDSKYRLTLSLDIAPPAVLFPKLLMWKHGDDSVRELSVETSDDFKFSRIEYDNNFFLVKTFIKEQNKVVIKPIGTPPKGKYIVKLYFINSATDVEFSTAAYLIFN